MRFFCCEPPLNGSAIFKVPVGSLQQLNDCAPSRDLYNFLIFETNFENSRVNSFFNIKRMENKK